MSYAEKNLAPGEAIVYRARYHWIYYRTALALLLVAAVFGLWWWIAGNRLGAETPASILGTMALVLAAAAGLVFLVRRIRASADEYVVTNRRVIRKYGLFGREAEHAPLEKIQDVTVRQGIAARLLGYGTIVLETASETGRVVIADIAEPERFRSAIWGQGPGRENALPAVPAVARAGPSAGQRLAELEDLRTRGLLTTEEYAAKRAEILSSV